MAEQKDQTMDHGAGILTLRSVTTSDLSSLVQPKDLWFGKKYFDMCICQKIFYNSSDEISEAELEILTRRETQSYPFRKCWYAIYATSLVPDEFDTLITTFTEQEKLYACIGYILRQNDPSKREKTLAQLKKHLNTTSSNEVEPICPDPEQMRQIFKNYDLKDPVIKSKVVVSPKRKVEEMTNFKIPTADMAKHPETDWVSVLNHHGNTDGGRPVYEDTSSGIVFCFSVKYKDLLAAASVPATPGVKKQEAKRRAAMEMCRKLGLVGGEG